MALELTTTIRRVSSSPKARTSLSPAAASGRAISSIRYITRDTAAEGVAWAGERLEVAGAKDGAKAVKRALSEAIQARAGEGGKQGRRVADRLIVSLPNDWPPQARRVAAERLSRHFAPPGSSALCLAAIHTDKPDNPHIHLLAVDGLESHESAQARADERRKKKTKSAMNDAAKTGMHSQSKTRARRRDVMRLNEGGRPKELRKEIAGILNGIAAEMDLHGVEWRSFEARGIQQLPTEHDGPEKRARIRKKAENEPEIDYTPPRPKNQPKSLGIFEPKPEQPKPIPKPSFSTDERPPAMATVVPTVRDPDRRANRIREAIAAAAAVPKEEPPKTKKVFKGGRWITLPSKPAGTSDER